MDGADFISLERVPKLCSRHAIIHSGYTGGSARHILSTSLVFTPWITTEDNMIVSLDPQRVLDCFATDSHKVALYRLFPDANFMAKGSDLRKYRPKCANNPRYSIAGSAMLGGLVQSATFAFQGVGVVKLITGTCVALLPGGIIVVAASGALGGGAYLLCDIGSDTVYLFTATGPVINMTEEHKVHLRRAYGWNIGIAKRHAVVRPL